MDITDRQLEDVFSLYGEVLFAQVALDKHTGCPRGFGFVTFADVWGMEEAIREMDGAKLDDGFITVRKAYDRNTKRDDQLGGNGHDKGYSSSGKRGSYRGRKTGQSPQVCPTARGILQKIGAEENRIFVGGLSEDITVSQLTDAFCRFGDILGLQLIIDGNTGHPRGFGFVTFADQRGFNNAIKDMDGRVIGGQVISVAVAQPTMRVNDTWNGSCGDRDDVPRRGNKPLGRSDCAFCGCFGHWARECPVYDGMLSNVGEGENCIFVEGISEDFCSFFLEDAFKHYGEVVAVQLIVGEADNWRSRGFCYISFADQQGMKGAMKFMNARELNGYFILVSKAQPTLKVDDTWNGFARYGDNYLLHDEGRYGGGDRLVGKSSCLNSECLSAGCRSVGGRFSSVSKLGCGRGGSRRGDRSDGLYSYSDCDHVDIRYEGCDSCTRDNKYPITLHLSGGDGFGLECSKQKPQNGYGKNKGYDRKGGPRSGGDGFGLECSKQKPQNGYGKNKGYDSKGGPRSGGDGLHLSGGDAFGLECSKQKPQNGYGKNKGYDCKGGPRSGGDGLHLSGGDAFGLECSKQKPQNGYGKNMGYDRKGGPRSDGDSYGDTRLACNDNGSAADIEQITGLARYDNGSAADTEQITGLARYDNGSAADIEQITITINRVRL